MGSGLMPTNGLVKLQELLNQHTFWARDRSIQGIKQLLKASSVVVSVWSGETLIGFGRASSDGIYRAVLWDIVVANTYQKRGIGAMIVETLINSNCIKNVERIYLMTTRSSNFYEKLGFIKSEKQILMVKTKD